MEPISAIVLSIALGAAATIGTAVVNAVVNDAYAALKDRVKKRYPKVSLEFLEQSPESKNRRAVVEEDLTAAGAVQDVELVALAQRLTELVRQHAPTAVSAIGVDLKDVTAANLRLADIAASGTGVKAERLNIAGDVDIRGVRAGVPSDKGR